MKNTHRQITRRFTALLAIASLAALLFVAAPAMAASSAQSGYSSTAGIQQTIDPAPKATATTTNKLPFTGLDVVAIVAVGGALLAVGFGVRKLSSSTLT
jgi:hypothetical protein